MEHILGLAERLDVDRIGLNVHNLAPVCFTSDRPEIPFWVAEDYGFHLGLAFGPTGHMPVPKMSTVAADQIVDLRLSEEELFAKVDRTAVRKGRKSGLTFRVSNSHGDLDVYYELAKLSATRTDEPLPPFDYYGATITALMPAGRAGLPSPCWAMPMSRASSLSPTRARSIIWQVSLTRRTSTRRQMTSCIGT